jgi:hypothetical protein
MEIGLLLKQFGDIAQRDLGLGLFARTPPAVTTSIAQPATC